jgi:type IV fimbrial biogenesis protein FimT
MLRNEKVQVHRRHARSRERSGGFTLVEVITVIAIASILAAVGIPNLYNATRSTRISAQANEFVGTLNYARSEAVKRGQRVTVCKSANGTSCATTGNWDQGWIVFVDANNNNTRETTEELLRVRDSLDGDSTLIGTTNTATYVSFLSNGGATELGTVALRNQAKGVDIFLIRSGRVRTERVS